MSYTHWSLKSLVIKSIFLGGILAGACSHAMQSPGASPCYSTQLTRVYIMMRKCYGDISRWLPDNQEAFGMIVEILESRSTLSVEAQLGLLDANYAFLNRSLCGYSGNISFGEYDVHTDLYETVKRCKNALLTQLALSSGASAEPVRPIVSAQLPAPVQQMPPKAVHAADLPRGSYAPARNCKGSTDKKAVKNRVVSSLRRVTDDEKNSEWEGSGDDEVSTKEWRQRSRINRARDVYGQFAPKNSDKHG